MKPRHPTPAERKIWRESNRFTKKKKDDTELAAQADAETFAEALHPKKQTPTRPAHEARKGTIQAPTAPPSPRPPPKRETTAPTPLRALPIREARRTFDAPIDATLDLHGLTKIDAFESVHTFLRTAHRRGHRHLLIITGKGRTGDGILRRELPHWLNEPTLRTLISAFANGSAENGGTGVTHVLVKATRA